jgi:hypothetical protein
MICANLQTNGQLAQASHGRRVREQSIAGLDLAGLLSRKFRHQRDVFGSCDPLGPSGLTPKLLVLTEDVHGAPVDRHGFAISSTIGKTIVKSVESKVSHQIFGLEDINFSSFRIFAAYCRWIPIAKLQCTATISKLRTSFVILV